ncbi:hypothetical protein CAOG_009500 [Capsaspora owczarzaki ATCC 30864]|uniref:AB hydrolase-1 domain-containing protein n=1 Tax=Capsaspora owczarzaki (strain ATCC 30864) TaxID=595528 RepID=A0A0D2WLR0_CAPO3|nr:hypothetical protein CAOG_009500 [Capsaspora owczarzaki ATCC 30864]
MPYVVVLQGESLTAPLIGSRQVAYDIDTLKNDMIAVIEHTAAGRVRASSAMSASGQFEVDQNSQAAFVQTDDSRAAKVHLVGHSMGGMVAMRVAHERPDLVASLTLIASTSSGSENSFKNSLAINLLSCCGVSLLKGSIIKSLFGRTFLHDPQRENERRGWQQHVANLNDSAAAVSRGLVSRPCYDREFQQLKLPILIIGGDEDPNVSQQLTRLRTLQPSATVVVVPHAGHAPQMEQPTAVNEALLSFYNRLASEGRG